MDDRRQNIAVGLTALLGVGGLAFMLLLFGYVPDLLQSNYRVAVHMSRAGGLTPGGYVTFRGLEVGVVESVDLNPPPQTGVVAVLKIRSSVRLPANVRAETKAGLFGSSAMVGLVAEPWPHGEGPVELLPDDSTASIQGSASSAVDMFTEVGGQVETLAAEWEEVGRNINALLELRDVEAVDSGNAIANASTVMVRLDQRLAEIEAVLAGVDQYVNDPQIFEDFKAAAANARKLSQEAPKHMQDLRDRYIALADDLSGAVTSLNETLALTRKPDGTLGKLLVDPKLYNNMNVTFERLQKALDDMRLLIQKWKDEGLPIQL